MASTEGNSGGIGFLGALALIFITLKLTGYIDWSWWWVLSPLWIPLAAFVAFLIVGGIIAILVGVSKSHLEHKKDRDDHRDP